MTQRDHAPTGPSHEHSADELGRTTGDDVAVDPFLGTRVHIVRSRQGRPNLPSEGCPFCVGGLEAPEAYEVKAFPNRWPALGPGNCEVVLYTPVHDATFASLGPAGARRVVDLWAQRTAALAGRPGTDFVLVFENRGREVGATIDHPHGQIYAFDHVPDRPHRRFAAGWRPGSTAGERIVLEHRGWTVRVDDAPVYPISLTVAPDRRVGDLASLADDERTAFAEVLVDLLGRLDRVFEAPLPYMMWINQISSDVAARYPDPWLNLEIVSPWRATGVARFIAAAEVACQEYFNPLDPEWVAARLREVARPDPPRPKPGP